MDDSNLDVRVEIKVAMFWRKLIGDAEYVKFDAKDLFRWYTAMELAGTDDIRELYYRRRSSSRPMPVVQGLVDRAPHPPEGLVRAWLEQYDTKVRTGGYWIGMVIFTTLVFAFGVYMNGCQNLKPLNPLLLSPPTTQAPMMQSPTSSVLPADAPVKVNPDAPVMQNPQLAPGSGISPFRGNSQIPTLPPSSLANSPLASAPVPATPTKAAHSSSVSQKPQ